MEFMCRPWWVGPGFWAVMCGSVDSLEILQRQQVKIANYTVSLSESQERESLRKVVVNGSIE